MSLTVNNLAPASAAESVTPSDSGNIDPSRGLYVGVSGDVKVDMINGDTVTLVGLGAGVVHPIQVVRVYSTGTTATDIVALR